MLGGRWAAQVSADPLGGARVSMLFARELTTVLVLLVALGCGLQSESSLRREFEANRQVFEELRRLFAEDSHLVRVAPDFTRLNDDWSWPREDIGLSNERWDLYRRLFEEAGVSAGVDRQGAQVFFYMSTVGLAVSGASRGVVYTDKQPSPVGEHLDELHGEGIIYVPLSAKWYLFHWAS